MKIIDYYIYKLITYAQKTPYFHLEGYMERFWLFNPYPRDTPNGKRGLRRLLPSVRIHHILRSDDGRAFHDHPWPFITVILLGGYWEIRPIYDSSGILIREGRQYYGAGSVLIRKATDWHRLELEEGKTAWTMFCTGKYRQTWGFLSRPENKIPYKKYLGLESDKSK